MPNVLISRANYAMCRRNQRENSELNSYSVEHEAVDDAMVIEVESQQQSETQCNVLQMNSKAGTSWRIQMASKKSETKKTTTSNF